MEMSEREILSLKVPASICLFVGVLLMLASTGCSDEPSYDPESESRPIEPASAVEPSDSEPLEQDDEIILDDLMDLAFTFDFTSDTPPDRIQLQDGIATRTYGGTSQDLYELQDQMAQGDLDGDGDNDAVAYIIERTAGTGVFHLLVPVYNNEGKLESGTYLFLGDRISVEHISVRNGLVEVSQLDRTEDAAMITINQRSILEIDFSQPEQPEMRVISTEPFDPTTSTPTPLVEHSSR